GPPIDQIADPIALPTLHEREIGAQRRLQDERLAVDDARLLALGDERPISGRREEAADPRAAGPNPLGEGPLRDELDLDLACSKIVPGFPVSRRRRSRSPCDPAAP